MESSKDVSSGLRDAKPISDGRAVEAASLRLAAAPRPYCGCWDRETGIARFAGPFGSLALAWQSRRKLEMLLISGVEEVSGCYSSGSVVN